ncbi:hypothetical protein GOEFS_094_00260 [Gordonia effusa NBRC 100432]|uniref:AB hydrolase-1 domain-containing protein n=1 Tax=Gordonia effusa NBRC 100432 TaxID=1077974 RepID=H0R3S6_9ACTN|nr:alpha/beta hydrolase [Gordonia effusa]GAB19727.1 hypothetical protein GOEFS_094_00260 [Gordonia effusa NBRC 100432]
MPAEKPIAVLVLESDIGEAPEYWQLLVDQLTEEGIFCLVHIRSGYMWRPTGDANVVELEVAARLAIETERLIYLAHSLGAPMAMLNGTFRQLGRVADAVILLDPVTPQMISELRSNEFELGRMRRALDISVLSVGLGMSRFADPIERAYLWYPNQVRQRCKAFRHNLRNALNARREFNFVVKHDLLIEPIRPPMSALLIHSEFAFPNSAGYADQQRRFAESLEIEGSAIVRLEAARLKATLTSMSALSNVVSSIVEFTNPSHGRQDLHE